MKSTIPYGKQCIDQNDIEAVVEVIESKFLTQGPNTVEFESALCKAVGASYATVVNSGTSALHIACLAAGVKSGDEVITSPITFVASANCAIYCNAKPVFADIDNRTYNLSAHKLEKKLTPATKAVIPVHFAGQSCSMENIRSLVAGAEKKYNRKIFIIEDACHALGSKYKNSKVGSCAFSDMAVMSFHPVKHITTGEGGVVFTNDKSLDNKLKRLRSHGITSNPEEFHSIDLAYNSEKDETKEPCTPNPWYYEQQMIGYNYRITNIQCALGISQLKKLELFKKKRRRIVECYNDAFAKIKHIRLPFEDPECDNNFHLYVLLFDFKQIGLDRASVMRSFRKKGIITQVHYIPVHLQYYFRKNYCTNWGDFPNAENYYQKCLSIPLFPSMDDDEIELVIKTVAEIARK